MNKHSEGFWREGKVLHDWVRDPEDAPAPQGWTSAARSCKSVNEAKRCSRELTKAGKYYGRP